MVRLFAAAYPLYCVRLDKSTLNVGMNTPPFPPKNAEDVDFTRLEAFSTWFSMSKKIFSIFFPHIWKEYGLFGYNPKSLVPSAFDGYAESFPYVFLVQSTVFHTISVFINMFSTFTWCFFHKHICGKHGKRRFHPILIHFSCINSRILKQHGKAHAILILQIHLRRFRYV